MNLFDFGSSYSFVSEFRFRAESFLLLLFPQWLSMLLHFSQLHITPEQDCAHRKQWKQLVTSSGRGERAPSTVLPCSPWWRWALGKQLRTRYGTAGASALPGLVIDPAKVEITHKCFVISLVLSLARQKVEQSWKSQCQELFFRALCFHLVWYWHSMEQHERDREKHLSEEERGPCIMKSSTEIRVGGVEIFLHARFLATFKLILSVHFNTVTEVA